MAKNRNKLTGIIIRILAATIIGLFNTLLIRPEDIGSWKNYAGYVFLGLAFYNVVLLFLFLKKQKGETTVG